MVLSLRAAQSGAAGTAPPRRSSAPGPRPPHRPGRVPLAVLPSTRDVVTARHASARAELRAAARSHRDDAVPPASWSALVSALELTAEAASAAVSGEDGAAALLAACAVQAVQEACTGLDRPRALVSARRPPVALPHASAALHRVARTGTRLAGVLFGADPVDAAVVLRALLAHEDALEVWQGVLLAGVRCRARAEAG